MQSDDTQETLVRSAQTQPALTPLALDDQLAFLLRRSHQHLTSLFQQMMTVTQLTSPQYNDIQERALADFSEQERAELLRLLGKLTR